jgi:carbamoyl-phosphate synthase large subunit
VRATFALGGLGSGFADTPDDLRVQCEKVGGPFPITLGALIAVDGGGCCVQAFAVSDQILIDQDLRGWKEVGAVVCR